jgi:hypothetical protein
MGMLIGLIGAGQVTDLLFLHFITTMHCKAVKHMYFQLFAVSSFLIITGSINCAILYIHHDPVSCQLKGCIRRWLALGKQQSYDSFQHNKLL